MGKDMRKLIFAIFILFAFNGCMVGPDYKRPTVDIPKSWRTPEENAQNTADTAWWEQFGDPALDELIKTAIQNNKDLKVASYRVEEFEGQVITTRAPLFPQVGAGVSARGTGYPKRARNRFPARLKTRPIYSARR